jgi:TolB protein
MLASVLCTRFVSGQGDSARGVKIGGKYGGGRPGLAVLPIAGSQGDSIRTIIQRDLENGDRVTIQGINAEDLPLVAGVPSEAAYDIFAKLGANFVLQGSIAASGGLHLALYEVATKTVVTSATFELARASLSPDWRLDVHRASDDVERWATGVQGIAATRIAFARGNQIWIMDSDGANAVAVEGSARGGSPAWDPTGRYLAFSTGPGTDAGGIMIRDLVANTTRRITPATNNGRFSSPAFFPDGSMLAYAYGIDGIDIFTIDYLKGGQPKNVTAGRRTMNTSPTFSRDGRQMAFSFGRLGAPDVYIADIDGSNAHPLTDEGFTDQSYRSDPTWSPDGTKIAYQSMKDGRFQIIISSPSGRNTQALTSDGQNEDPSWASDSRHLVFMSTRGGSKQLWVLDTQSGRMRQLTRGAEAKNGAWSAPLARR